MRVHFFGATRTTTGSVYLLELNGQQILLECGLFQGHRDEAIERNRKFPFEPKKIDAVVLSHAHIDHCGGCMADDGSRHFPNAQYYISQADYDYWTDEKKVGPDLKVFYETATKNLPPNKDRMVFIKDGQEFLPGIQAIAAPGHTVGHTIFMISSGGKQLCYIGDLTHHPVLLMEKPLTEFAYDTDPKQSAQSRVKMLTMLAEKRIPVLAYHFAWPGVGHVAKQGDGFRYHPEGMNMVL
jgi:glyoxylase-like metal-dependent hydrolase (beta-lactamase superfamily II)